jgi:hypothetical protein
MKLFQATTIQSLMPDFRPDPVGEKRWSHQSQRPALVVGQTVHVPAQTYQADGDADQQRLEAELKAASFGHQAPQAVLHGLGFRSGNSLASIAVIIAVARRCRCWS